MSISEVLNSDFVKVCGNRIIVNARKSRTITRFCSAIKALNEAGYYFVKMSFGDSYEYYKAS